jgi:hypothetical protein
VAIWQGVLEINFFGPQKSLAREEQLVLFKDFWESEVPRVGEGGALGWRRFMENETSSEVPGAAADAVNNSLEDRRLFESWCAAERLRSKSMLPARTMDEVVEDGMFNVPSCLVHCWRVELNTFTSDNSSNTHANISKRPIPSYSVLRYRGILDMSSITT